MARAFDGASMAQPSSTIAKTSTRGCTGLFDASPSTRKIPSGGLFRGGSPWSINTIWASLDGSSHVGDAGRALDAIHISSETKAGE